MKAINRNHSFTPSYLALLTAPLSFCICAGILHRRGLHSNPGATQSGAIIIHNSWD
jgi:hypothetical protein